jgi:hypothetical protein
MNIHKTTFSFPYLSYRVSLNLTQNQHVIFKITLFFWQTLIIEQNGS